LTDAGGDFLHTPGYLSLPGSFQGGIHRLMQGQRQVINQLGHLLARQLPGLFNDLLKSSSAQDGAYTV
jgi:hypothetical protein